MSLKRKASVSSLSLDGTPKKVRRSLENTPPYVSISGNMTQKDGYDSEEHPVQIANQLSNSEGAAQSDAVHDTMQLSEAVARLLASYDQVSDEKVKRWTELVYIVFAKENFEQDPCGQSGFSTTTGPLSNVQLRDVYCAQFDKDVGAEAAMKRYRNDRQKVYDAYPEYPQKITYAPKQAKVKRPRAKVNKKPKVGEEEVVDDDYASKLTDSDANGSVGDDKTDDLQKPIEESGVQKTLSEAEAFAEHRQNMKEDDKHHYVENSSRIRKNKHKSWINIMLTDSSEDFMGAVSVSPEHLSSSRAYLALRKYMNVREIWLTGVSRLSLQRYIQCISPVRLSSLPRWDFGLRPHGNNPAMAVSSCKPITWNFEATFDLYELATQLRDCHVRTLVLSYWREQLQANVTYEVGLLEMQLLYDRLATDDPALQFWTKILEDLLESDDSKMDTDFVESGSATSFFVANKYNDEGDATFHSQYHRCRHSRPKNGPCQHLKKLHTEASYSLNDFHAIARRLLQSEGWREEDKNVRLAAITLKVDLHSKFSSL